LRSFRTTSSENYLTPDSWLMSHSVHVTAPSRLHFGLWSLGGALGRQFGGIGAMIDRPGLGLRIEALEGGTSGEACATAEGPLARRAEAFARRWAEFHGVTAHHCRITVERAPQEHAGLGTGTQLALAVAAGLNAFCGLPSQTAQELAISVGRGLRSAVGTYGFLFGGLIVEQGKLPGEPISPLDCRIDLPEEWRFVLLRETSASGLAGEDEVAAMASLPAVPPAVTEELIGLVRDGLVPAAATGDFPAFSATLYRYGNLSGQCFAARQGGPYNGPVLTSLVERVRRLGFEGVGQSSWGPTLYVAVATESEAVRLVSLLGDDEADRRLEIEISAPCNCGAQIEVRQAGRLPHG
jgi:beta-ribofuranosylaminobenzene 5'-phosphate synthase